MQVSITEIIAGSTKDFLEDINANFTQIGNTLNGAHNIFSGTQDPTKNTALTNSQDGDIYIQYEK